MIHWNFKDENEAGDPVSDAKLWENLLSRKDLGYLQLPERLDSWQASSDYARKIAKTSQCLVVIGMGGSSLGGQMLVDILAKNEKTVCFLKNSDPFHLNKTVSQVKKFKAQEVAYLIISKSGGTVEVAALISALSSTKESYFIEANKYVITENKDSALSAWAKENSIEILEHPIDVGGRFSVLSPVGLVPAAFVGADLEALRKGALNAFKTKDNLLALMNWFHEAFLNGIRMSVFWSYSERLNYFSPWLQQLWAESLGKKENLMASVPVLSYGATDQHSVLQQYLESENDKHFIFLRDLSMKSQGPELSKETGLGNENLDSINLGELLLAQSLGTQRALENDSYSCGAIELDEVNATSLGELIMSFELLVGLMGEKLEINAYDQPSVEKGKIITKQILSEK